MKRHKGHYGPGEYRTILPANENVTSGVKEKPQILISGPQMRVSWRRFWAKRGFSTPPMVWE